jgi:putative proteasome-type protease
MTYCVAMALQDGLLFASDSRTNAGVDHISTFSKMNVFEQAGERMIVLLSSGNLATTQSVVNLLRTRSRGESGHLMDVASLYDAAVLVGQTLREVIERDSGGTGRSGVDVDFGASLLLGGQIRGEAPRLFNIYRQGNFIEASEDTPYFQIGEAKYGKPIIDRIVHYRLPLAEAVKCTLLSFDSTIRSNLSVGLPLDVLVYQTDSFAPAEPHRIDAEDPYFNQLRKSWSQGLRKVFRQMPEADWLKRREQD